MTSSSSEPSGFTARRLQALADPVRLAVLRSLSLRPSSAAELARAHDLPLEKVRYKLGRLRRDGLIRIHAERQTRGTVERTYVADPRRAASYESELVAGTTGARRLFQLPLATVIFREILESLRVGAFRKHRGDVVARVPLKVDALGFEEVERALDAALEQLLSISEESMRRLELTGEAPLPALVALLNLEEVT